MLKSMGLQRVRCHLATEKQQLVRRRGITRTGSDSGCQSLVFRPIVSASLDANSLTSPRPTKSGLVLSDWCFNKPSA